LAGVEWDAEVPSSILKKWANLHQQLCEHTFRIPRIVCENYKQFEIHGFCDASSAAYAACIYIRSFDKKKSTMIRLLCAKTRVAPIKTISIPHLELCGAVLLIRLLTKIVRVLPHPPSSTHLWTDSTIVLQWIKKTPSTWKTFVANRVSEIQQSSSPKMWDHVNTSQNPADLASRGHLPSQLDSPLWWNGPSFLKDSTKLSWLKRPNLELDTCYTSETRTIRTFSA